MEIEHLKVRWANDPAILSYLVGLYLPELEAAKKIPERLAPPPSLRRGVAAVDGAPPPTDSAATVPPKEE